MSYVTHYSSAEASHTMRSLRRHMLGVSALAVVLLGGVGGWAATTSLSSAVVAQGEVVVDNNVKKVQHLNGGIVSEVLVKEGDRVREGQVLIRLDGMTAKANLAIVQNSLAQFYVKRARLQAERIGAASFVVDDQLTAYIKSVGAENLVSEEEKFFDNRKAALTVQKDQLNSRKLQLGDEIKGLDVQIKATEDSVDLTDQELASVNALYAQKLVTLQRVTTLKRQRAELEGDRGQRIASRAQAQGKISEIDLQIVQVDEDRRSEISKELTDVQAKISEYEERQVAALTQLNRLDITSPADGRVLQLTVHTVKGVVNAGDTLMNIVPDSDDLTIEAKVAGKDIDQVHTGQSVDLRFSAFDQRTTPVVEGEVVSVAADTVKDQNSNISYYPTRIRPKPESLAKLKGMSLYPGMPVDVYMKIADRSVISYFMKPLSDQMAASFKEE